VSIPKDREDSKKTYKYFILPEEIESMVEGMYVKSKVQHRNLDEIFNDYLSPFIDSKYITQSEYLQVMNTWVTHALELYPDAKFSNKVKSIINSI
jgi:hypothetical protein